MNWQPPPPNQPGWGQPPGGPYVQPPPGPYAYDPNMKPDRSSVILVLTICSFMMIMIGCIACGPLVLISLGLSIPAIVMGRRDLRDIDSGVMVPTGRETTNISVILAIVSSAFSALAGLFFVVILLLYGGLIIAVIAAGAAGA